MYYLCKREQEIKLDYNINPDAATGKQTAKKIMKTTKVIAALTTIAAFNPDGYTVDARTLQPIRHGFAVALSATQNSFGPEGLAKVVDYVAAHPEVDAFGGWYNSKTGQYYYDATIIVHDLSEAIELARVNKQLAFFCLDTLTEYDQDGNKKANED